ELSRVPGQSRAESRYNELLSDEPKCRLWVSRVASRCGNYVCFAPDSDRRADIAGRLSWAMGGPIAPGGSTSALAAATVNPQSLATFCRLVDVGHAGSVRGPRGSAFAGSPLELAM